MFPKIPPTNPGQGHEPISPQGPHAPQKEAKEGYDQSTFAAWNQMFHGAASAEELKQIINAVLKTSIDEMKKQQAKMLEAIKKMRRDQEEG